MRRTLAALSIFALAACGRDEPARLPGGAVNEGSGGDSRRADGSAAETPSAPKAGRISRFTRLDDSRCGPRRTVQETGDWVRTCRGVDGYGLEWSSGDLREDLAIVKDGKEVPLGIPVKVANGAFDSVAPTLDWRGPVREQADTMIVRVRVANGQGEDDGGQLTVVRLGKTPCIIGIVRPGPGQSNKARAVADGDSKTCLGS